ncbi:transposase [Micromonospora sp. NPDC000018]|uniref:transposase n=1 Tax=Micromonospora sp. NPDC000018 TaxID=3154239 RepID=UPI003327E083
MRRAPRPDRRHYRGVRPASRPRLITSFPGLAEVSGARILAEIGDDRTRFADARALKAYAGSAPITRVRPQPHRRAPTRQEPTPRRHRLRVGFATLITSPGCRAHYDRRPTAGDRHASAQRDLVNRLVGLLHHCLANRTPYDENRAFPPSTDQPVRHTPRRPR